MNRLFFEMPDEVINELMDDDCADRVAEAMGASDWERGYVPRDRFATRVDITNGPSTRACDRCGCKRLSWTNTSHGWRLTYGRGWGNLEGKIHGCEQ